MIPLCSRFDSVLFTPKTSAIASYGNYSRSPKADSPMNGQYDRHEARIATKPGVLLDPVMARYRGKIGAKVVSHGRYVVFQMAEVAIPRQMFHEILRLIAELRPQPPVYTEYSIQHGRREQTR
jgi:hypothetical protein